MPETPKERRSRRKPLPRHKRKVNHVPEKRTSKTVEHPPTEKPVLVVETQSQINILQRENSAPTIGRSPNFVEKLDLETSLPPLHMATLTYDPSDPNAPELNEAEQEALAIGEAAQADQEELLAGKFKDAEALEQAYIELQQKLGNNDGTEKLRRRGRRTRPKK